MAGLDPVINHPVATPKLCAIQMNVHLIIRRPNISELVIFGEHSHSLDCNTIIVGIVVIVANKSYHF